MSDIIAKKVTEKKWPGMLRPNKFGAKNHFYPAIKVNIDLSHRCPLECLRCARQSYMPDPNKNDGSMIKKPIPGRDLTMSEMEKIVDYFDKLQFCGQYSDPIHHPKLIEILKMIKEKDKKCQVHVASNYKSDEWFKKAFEANPDCQWWFGIDGLPGESHQYRIHQDGDIHFERLKMAKKMLNTTPIWQYIVFSYNEKHVETAMKMAEEIGVIFTVINSGRWDKQDTAFDVLKPKTKPGDNHIIDD